MPLSDSRSAQPQDQCGQRTTTTTTEEDLARTFEDRERRLPTPEGIVVEPLRAIYTLVVGQLGLKHINPRVRYFMERGFNTPLRGGAAEETTEDALEYFKMSIVTTTKHWVSTHFEKCEAVEHSYNISRHFRS